MNRRSVLFAPALLLTGCATAQSRPDNAALVKQVTDTELAFAKTMADRDHAAFASFIADEAVFLSGGKPLRGKAAVVEAWKRSSSRSWRVIDTPSASAAETAVKVLLTKKNAITVNQFRGYTPARNIEEMDKAGVATAMS